MVGRRKLKFVPFEVENGVVPKAQHAMTVGHCPIQLGVWGCCKPPMGPGQSPGGGSGGEAPRSSEDHTFCSTKKRSKTYSDSVIFTFFETTISVQGHIKLGFG